ncbi:hypothetical protein CspHIS471_0703460 [Cutaneotrichosporon sp. HIS471]|nr:hypothetical protein CspHIS471_0703460 [Cutaneotrichosporon sp. HIS471]
MADKVYEIEIALRSGTTVLILRRYTEFHLRRTIPTLPGKNHMHKLSPEFLQDRRPRLQRFLRTVALHPEMGQGDGPFSHWVLGSGSAGPPAALNGRLGLKLPDLLSRPLARHVNATLHCLIAIILTRTLIRTRSLDPSFLGAGRKPVSDT